MRVSIDNTRWWETPLAALIFFTRLPFWRIAQPDKSCYRRVVEYWPLAGWLTGGIMAATLYGASMLFPYPIAVVLAIAMRLLVTGALCSFPIIDSAVRMITEMNNFQNANITKYF